MNATLPEPARRKPLLRLIVEYLPVAAAILTILASLAGGIAGAVFAWSRVNVAITDVSRELKIVQAQQSSLDDRMNKAEIEAIRRQLANAWTVERHRRWILFANQNLFPSRLPTVEETEYLPLRPVRGAETSRD